MKGASFLRTLGLGCLLVSGCAQANELAKLVGTHQTMKPIHSQKEYTVLYDGNTWFVKDMATGVSHAVNKFDVHEDLRGITHQQFSKLMSTGKVYIDIKQLDDGSFKVSPKYRLNGGGPITGCFVYWASKGVAYGTLAAGAVAGATTVGGPAAAAATSYSMASTGLGSAASAATASGIASAGGSAAAATSSSAALAASGGCLATLTAGIEAGSATAGALAGAIPFLP